MNKKGPIIIIEDDMDDAIVMQEVFDELRYENKVIFFVDGEKALDYLDNTNEKPFLILSNIRLPKVDGFAIRDMLNDREALHLKCIPYVFFTTVASPNAVTEAYCRSIQGFFVKPDTYAKLQMTVKKVVEYWQECQEPLFALQ